MRERFKKAWAAFFDKNNADIETMQLFIELLAQRVIQKAIRDGEKIPYELVQETGILFNKIRGYLETKSDKVTIPKTKYEELQAAAEKLDDFPFTYDKAQERMVPVEDSPFSMHEKPVQDWFLSSDSVTDVSQQFPFLK
jgi:hypothetical protein